MGDELSERQLSQADFPAELSLPVLLGLGNASHGGWVRLRGLQYSYLARIAYRRVVLHAIAAAAILFMFFTDLPLWLSIGWTAALAALLGCSVRLDQRMADVDRRPITRWEIRLHTLLSGVIATLWGVPILIFSRYGAPGDIFAIWGVQAMLLAAVALWLAPVPLGAWLIILLLGSSAIAALAMEHHFEMTCIAVSFTVMTLAGSLKGARHYLAGRIAEAGFAEKQEVVSLLLREFEETGADWLWETDTLRCVRGVGAGFAQALGHEAREIEGAPFFQLISGPGWEAGIFPPSIHDLAERLQRRESFSNLIVRVTVDGHEKWWELSGMPKLDETGRFLGFRGVGSDVTEQRESSEKIAYLAQFDTLTGLPNRMMLIKALGEALYHAEQRDTQCAFLMIDLDRFKQINDSLGHLVGDALLAQVAGRLESLMGGNELCGRLGGDEFAIVMREASDMRRVDEVAGKAIALLSQPYEVDGHTLYVGCSVGSAIGPRDGMTIEALIRNADLALYRAKGSGRGIHVHFDPSLHRDAEDRHTLEQALRHALERNEFHLNFQPVVDTRSECLVGFEALLRWTSAEHGIVEPGKFIPVAEDTRLIVPIGEWVLREACREAARWPHYVKVTVNVSGEQLLAPGFTDTVAGALTDCGLAPQRLEIEVTESIFLRDDVIAQAALDQVIALGCSVALDDFGTGSSSLDYLRKLRFSTVKIDRSFVKGAAAGNRQSLATIRAVVAMASCLEIATTAEGVEMTAEARMIHELGCDNIQGYYFGMPMAAAEVQALFAREQAGLRA